jgi:HEAT repeat protein
VARAGDDATASPDSARDLRAVVQREAPLSDRVAAARRVVAAGSVGDVDAALRAGAVLAAEAPEAAGPLLRLARDEDVPGPAASDWARAAVDAAIARASTPEAKAGLLACGLYVGRFPRGADEVRVLGSAAEGAPASDALAWAAAGALEGGSRDALPAVLKAAALLDAASADDLATSRPALDALLEAARAGDAPTLSVLLRAAGRGTSPTPKGLVPRRVRAILVLGTARAKGARTPLEEGLDDKQDGWVRVAAATALGDLGDPAAAPALCHVLFYLGDVHRLRDGWEWPGGGNTDVPEEAWADVEYFCVDVAAADALLRLGARHAAEWLVRERLGVATGRWRIRVLQDAVDALRRAFPKAPRGYVPDGGLPDRDRAQRDLLAWWATGPRLERPLDERDPGFAAEAKAVVARLGQKSVMELQIAKRTLALLGSASTPALLEALPASTSRVQRAEIAFALGTVRDRRAFEPLLALTHDDAPNVRAAAAEALAAYVDGDGDPVLDGEAKDATGRAIARWIEMLDDEEDAPRASAMKGLVSAPPRGPVRAVVEAHDSSTHPENAFSDYQIAEEIVRAVQTGRGIEAPIARLSSPDLFVRRATWEHLVRALRLDPRAFDPGADARPGGADAVAVAVKDGLARRRDR